MTDFVLRLEPYFYVHIHDSNLNNTTLVTGPATITVAQHQQVVVSAQPFVVVPPQHYCIVENPVEMDRNGQPIADRRGQVRVRIGEREVRLHREPFPLYPGETVVEQKPLIVLSPLNALMLRANASCTDNNNVARVAGDEWLLRGPAVYVPNVAIDVCELRDAINVQQGSALRLRARNAFVDATGVHRTAFEEYLWTRPGAYIVGVEEVLVQVVNPIVLTPELGLHVECTESFVDTRPWAAGVERRPGQKYLVTNAETTEFLELTTERIEARVNLLKLTRRQWVVVLDPVVDGVQQLGRRKVVSNAAFFLQPGERLESAVRDVYVLSADEALLLCALEDFEDTDAKPAVRRSAGELWLLQGPRDYIPHCSVRVERSRDGSEKRKRIVLADGEGVYVRNTQSGDVRAVIGGSYMLSATEELWEKELPAIVEEKLQRQASAALSYMESSTGKLPARDKTRVVRFLIPHNAISQVYDYKKRTQRTIAGPDAVLLGPDEQFTVLSLSGSEWDPKRPQLCLPKQPGAIKSLFLYLGPSSMSDVVIVETSDHARLQLQMSFDWYFDANPTNLAEVNQCFSVPDFVGDACSCIASRVRASVASVPFDTFHRHSAKVVRCAVFGVDPATNEPKSQLVIKSNRLVITSVDIQALDVLDEKTKIALQQSVKMAIEITTQSQEATARQEASVREQRARGLLERQQIEDTSANEVERKKLIEATTASDSISSTGRAKAEAKARSEAAELEGDVAVKVARIRAETGHVKDGMSVSGESKKRDQELEHKSSIDMAEVDYSKQLSAVEAQKFQRVMSAVGQDTVVALARAGPEAQARLLKSLGLEGYLITDGTNPINLFNTAKGLTSAMPPAN